MFNLAKIIQGTVDFFWTQCMYILLETVSQVPYLRCKVKWMSLINWQTSRDEGALTATLHYWCIFQMPIV